MNATNNAARREEAGPQPSRTLARDTRESVRPYDLDDARLHRAASRTRPLVASAWNGHLEMTDECPLGLALFQVDTSDVFTKEMHMTFKDGMKAKRVDIHRITRFESMRVYLFRRGYTVTITDLMLKHLGDLGVEQYLSEYTLVSQLLDKVNRIDSVRDRWIPTFVSPLRQIAGILNLGLEVPLIGPSFEIQGGYTLKPRTLGQWFLMLLLERVRRQISSGIGLRTLIYCVCWCTRLVAEHDYERLRASATMIKAWLLQDTCQDCVYKYLRELRADVAFEYYFNIADSFSECILLPDLRTSIRIGPCSEDGSRASETPGFLRTFGQHSFLTSPYSNTTLPVRVKLLENEPMKTFMMTERQTATLLTMLDLHARVLRARDWKQCRRAFYTCLRERRANNGTSLALVMRQVVEDLVSLSSVSIGMSTTVAHFALLIFRGMLSVEIIQAYRFAKDNMNLSAHTFIVRHCFLRAPTPDTQAYADTMYPKFLNASDAEKSEMLQYALERYDHEYELSKDEIDLELHWNIPNALAEDDIVDLFDGSTITFESENARALDLGEGSYSAEAGAASEFLTDKDRDGPMELSDMELAMINPTNVDKGQGSTEAENNGSRYSMANDSTFTLFRSPMSENSTGTASSIVVPDDTESLGHEEINRDV